MMSEPEGLRIMEEVEMAEVRILLIENDDLLIADMVGFGQSEIVTESLSDAMTIEPISLAGRCDVLVINIDLPGGFDLVGKVTRMRIGPPVIALASKGMPGHSLEHTLTLAELYGAGLTLPKPIDADELTLAAMRLLAQSRPLSPQMSALADALERRLSI
jgi:DNA-binding response OmpR family regulator